MNLVLGLLWVFGVFECLLAILLWGGSARSIDLVKVAAGANVAIAFFSAVTLAVAVLAFFVSQGQMQIMQGQLDAMIRDQLPYVSTSDTSQLPIFAKAPEAPHGQILWTFNFTNSGRGMAYNLIVDRFLRLGDGPFKRSYRGDQTSDAPPSETNEFASGKSAFTTIVSELLLGDQIQFEALKSKDKAIEALIEFSYDDFLGKRHRTTVCRSLLASGALAVADPQVCTKQKAH